LDILSLSVGILIGGIFFFLISRIIGDKTSLRKVQKINTDNSDPTYWLLINGADEFIFTNDQLTIAKELAPKIRDEIQD
jgi:hypothetical protein